MSDSTAVERRPGSQGRLTNVDIAEQQRACYQLRLQHYTIREISALTGLSVGTVHSRIQDAIATYVTPFVEQYRTMERERLEGLSRRVLAMMSKPHYVLKDGTVLTVDDEPVEDIGITLACVDRLLRIQERRAKLEGLDAAPKTEADEGTVSPEDVELVRLVKAAREHAEAQLAKLRGKG
ncbi:sigma factor-like helix-turn-helix DNA-binding protein [Saccharothrix xinjiangensis]|uniref:Sigma factor-like helix-turn-helix DNA-binding protein n=1 Tax=Saccharothrix xinjiangensis TaxID=204798 RepID=A0ABV9XT85_9PSEU